ncbi:MAG TPA: helix-turn-helix transcriptional regulator, partial [Solirubrobacteraceae bacterium]
SLATTTPAPDIVWSLLPADHPPHDALTAREREVLTLVAAGLQTAEMAERFVLSPETVNSHVQNAMRKLGSRTRAGAVTIALVTGEIAWGPEPVAKT